MPRIMLVEDEPSIREVLSRYLEREGFEVVACAEAGAARRHLEAGRVDLAVLDVMLPGPVDGIELCRTIRQRGTLPVLMLTARTEAEDRILGFGAGADDYVVKPFVPLEVVLRVKAILRRSQSQAPAADAQPEALVFDDLALDRAARTVTLSGRPVELTLKEFDLLWTLAEHAGQVLSRTQLMARVWHYDDFGDTGTVSVHIRKLREKIERDPSQPRRIRTVWGYGYRFERESAS